MPDVTDYPCPKHRALGVNAGCPDCDHALGTSGGLSETEWLDIRKAAVQWYEQVLGGQPGPEPLMSTVERILAEREAATEALRAQIADYENRITWNTTCANCAHLLDKSYSDYARADKAEAELEALRARVGALANEWDEYGPGTEADRVLGQQILTVGFAVSKLRAAAVGDS